ncbi:hypothetical protein AAG570_000467 [Ranatra chinensis]|uniref:NTF2 domain-containing protein n=1 Tax=Ranatra chinensis TaxID=642074 RepID=A0ABD0YX74_9HEMI
MLFIEAVEVITTYEDDLRSLLNRKKITKAVLFSYLHWKKLHPSATADKATLVETILDLRLGNTVSFSEPSTSESVTISSMKSIVKQQYGTSETNSLTNSGCSSEQVDVMALKFTEWFYQLVNEDFIKKGGLTLSEADFWKDCNISIKLSNETDSETLEAHSNEDAVSAMRGVVRTHNLFFSPNLTKSGVKGKFEPHGIVLVVACGTLHRGAGDCIGIFEQLFSLIKDPLCSDNWKIKSTDMRLKTKADIQEKPTVKDGDFGTFWDLKVPD